MMSLESLGLMIDTLYTTRQKRLEVTKEVDALKAQEVAMRQEILDMLENAGLAKASGAMATCGVKTSIEPVINDWEAVHSWIRVNNRFDLLQKRLSAPAWRDLANDGLLVPGTESMTVVDLSLTKSTRG